MTPGLTSVWVRPRTVPWRTVLEPGDAPVTSIATRRGSFSMTLRARFTGESNRMISCAPRTTTLCTVAASALTGANSPNRKANSISTTRGICRAGLPLVQRKAIVPKPFLAIFRSTGPG